jgi:hypothetical protein
VPGPREALGVRAPRLLQRGAFPAQTAGNLWAGGGDKAARLFAGQLAGLPAPCTHPEVHVQVWPATATIVVRVETKESPLVKGGDIFPAWLVIWQVASNTYGPPRDYADEVSGVLLKILYHGRRGTDLGGSASPCS